MSDPVGEVSLSIDDSLVIIVTRAQRLSRVALKFLYAVRGVPEPPEMSFGWAKMPETITAEQDLDEAIAWLEEIGA